MNITLATPWGYVYEYKRLTREEGEGLINYTNGRQLVEFQEKIDLETKNGPYLLDTGQVVRIFDISASCYKSIKDYHCSRYNSGIPLKTKKILKDGPYQKIEYLPNGEKIFYTRLRKIDGETLRHVLPPVDPTTFSSDSSNQIELFLTAESALLEFRKIYKDYNLYQNEIDYQKCQNKQAFVGASNRISPNPFIVIQMMGRNPWGEEFISKVDELADQLPKLLNVKKSTTIFNFKFNTLKKIERILFRNVITDRFSDQIFLPLYAYYGKTFIQENSKYDYDIKWTLRQDELYKFWVPDIQLNGHYLEIYDTILKMLDPEAVSYTHLTLPTNREV